MQDLTNKINSVKSKESLVEFIATMVKDYSDDWENADLPSFLEAMSGWIEDMEGYYENTGKEVPKNINWRFIADALLAAKMYE